MDKPRSIEIDTLRGLACVFLVLYHVIGSPDTGLRIGEGEPLRLFNNALGYVRMPLFAFLSGVVYSWRPYQDGPESIRRFVRGKARRLLVPMLVVGTFFAITQALVPDTNTQVRNWWLLHVIPVGHFWFLESLFWIFVALVLLEHAGWLARPGPFATVYAGCIALFLTLPLPEALGLEGACHLAPFFFAGVAGGRFGPMRSRRAVMIATLLLAAGAADLLIQHALVQVQTTSWGALLVGVSACLLLLNSNLRILPLARVGFYSFVIYLLHPFFSAAARMLLNAVDIDLLALHVGCGLLAGLLGPIWAERLMRWNGLFRRLVLGQGAARPVRGAINARA